MYAQKDFSAISNKNILLPVVSNVPSDSTLHIRSAATVYTSLLEETQSIKHSVNSDQGVFVYVTKGTLLVNDISCQVGDQLRIQEESSLLITATETAHFVLIQVAL